jgi:hypothetical protein
MEDEALDPDTAWEGSRHLICPFFLWLMSEDSLVFSKTDSYAGQISFRVPEEVNYPWE